MRSQPTVMLFPKVLVLLLMTVALAQVDFWSKKDLLKNPLKVDGNWLFLLVN